jgi:2Fe-2S ferredoxin
MPKVTVITREGNEVVVEHAAGVSLMEVIRDNVPDQLMALCGGCCSCATCHVYVDPAYADKLPAASYDEKELIDGTSYKQSTSRLACQIPFTDVLDGAKITIAPED